jgi:hypothetical protein
VTNSTAPYKPQREPTQAVKLIGLIAVLIVTLEVYRRVFLFLRDGSDNPWLIFAVSLLWGVGGIWFLFVLTSSIVELMPRRIRDRVMPWVFVSPALALVFYYLLIPTFRTIYLSLFDANSVNFIGLENYQYAFTSPAMLESFRNNIAWLIFGGGMSVVLGLFIAALSDRTRPDGDQHDFGIGHLAVDVRLQSRPRRDANWPAERDSNGARWPELDPLDAQQGLKHVPVDRDADLVANRFCNGHFFCRHQRRALGNARGGTH